LGLVNDNFAGLVILDAISRHPQLSRWPQLHLARADLLRRLGRNTDARHAYRTALQLNPSPPERTFIVKRIHQLES
jgi:RNA polymerase sigma-70 factor (ECF subfamily)